MSRPFTIDCVSKIHLLSVAGLDPVAMAFRLGRTKAEVDRALWALVGRDIPEAVSALNTPRLMTEQAA